MASMLLRTLVSERYNLPVLPCPNDLIDELTN